MHATRLSTLKFTKIITLVFAAWLGVMASAVAQEAPDALLKRISQEVLDTAKSDKDVQNGNRKHIAQLVEEKIFPYVDFQRTTMLAAGRYWREATPEQQKQLTDEFHRLLVSTYSGAVSKIKDQQVNFKPLRMNPSDTEVEVRSEVVQPRGEPITLSYRLEKTDSGWKVYDLNVFGAWLVETYKSSFSSEINKSGMDGLIKMLQEKNKKLEAKS